MTGQRLLLAHETTPSVAGGPPRMEYEVTEKGEQEYFDLLRGRSPAATHVSICSPRRSASSTTSLGPRPSTSYGGVLETMDEWRASIAAALPLDADLGTWGPVGEVIGLWQHTAESRSEWTRRLIRRLEEGAYRMAGEEAQGARRGCPAGPRDGRPPVAIDLRPGGDYARPARPGPGTTGGQEGQDGQDGAGPRLRGVHRPPAGGAPGRVPARPDPGPAVVGLRPQARTGSCSAPGAPGAWARSRSPSTSGTPPGTACSAWTTGTPSSAPGRPSATPRRWGASRASTAPAATAPS